MRQPHFWPRQGTLLAGLFLATFILSMAMTALLPHWPPAGVVVLGGVVLAVLWNLFIYVWKQGDTTTKTRHITDQATELAVGLGLLAAFVIVLLSYSDGAPATDRWLKLAAMSTCLASGIALVLRPLRTILLFTTKPWNRGK